MSGGPVGGGLRLPARLKGEIFVSGRAAYYGAVPDPGSLAREARRRVYEGELRLETEPQTAERVVSQEPEGAATARLREHHPARG